VKSGKKRGDRPPLADGSGIIRARPLILAAWAVCTGRRTPTEALTAAAETKSLAEALAARARQSHG